MSAPRAAAQLLRKRRVAWNSFRPLLRGRGRRSAPSLPSRETHTLGWKTRPGTLRVANPCHNILQSNRGLQLQIAINCRAENAISCRQIQRQTLSYKTFRVRTAESFSAEVGSLQASDPKPGGRGRARHSVRAVPCSAGIVVAG